MDWETISAISEFVAAVAVVVSILYLAAQVRDGKNATLSATHYQVTESINSVFSGMAGNSELTHIYLTGNSDPSQLSHEELHRYLMLVGGIFARYNNYFLQHEKGTLNNESWEIAVNHMHSLMRYPGIQFWWRHSREHYLAGMAAILDKALETATISKES